MSNWQRRWRPFTDRKLAGIGLRRGGKVRFGVGPFAVAGTQWLDWGNYCPRPWAAASDRNGSESGSLKVVARRSASGAEQKQVTLLKDFRSSRQQRSFALGRSDGKVCPEAAHR